MISNDNASMLSCTRCYSIFDRVANRFLPAFLYDDDWFAISYFKTMAVTPGNAISGSPDDFSLYYIGTFDTITGSLNPIEIKEYICKASDFVGKSEEEKNEVQNDL